jgi:N-acetylneuraminate synthase
LQDDTRYAYWKRMEFTPEQWSGLVDHARDKGLVFLSSAFSVDAVSVLRDLGMPAWKVASGELGSTSILDSMIEAGGPFLISTGMSGWPEIDRLVGRLRGAGRDVAVMQCTTKYPTPLEQVGLNVMDEMRARYGAPVGLSDHSGRVEPALAALARKADLLELHITLDRGMFGPDVPASLTVAEFRRIADFRDALAVMDSHPVNKNSLAEELAQVRAMFRRSLAPARALPAGTLLTADVLTAKKPGTGIPEADLMKVIGRKLARDVKPERLLRYDDLEGGS